MLIAGSTQQHRPIAAVLNNTTSSTASHYWTVTRVRVNGTPWRAWFLLSSCSTNGSY